MTEGLPHLDDDEYEYEHEDGTRVTVRVRDRRNGGKIGVYHYDASGEKQAYIRYAIDDVDKRRVNVLTGGEEVVVPNAVDAALHAGGWQTDNTFPTNVREADPVVFALLDMRDMLDYAHRAADDSLYVPMAKGMMRATEEMAVMLFETDLAASTPDGAEAVLGALIPDRVGNPRDTLNEALRKAVYEENRTGSYDRTVEWLEDARVQYRAGLDYDAALKNTTPDELRPLFKEDEDNDED